MHTPSRLHTLHGTPANSKRKTIAPAEDTIVRNVRPKWDPKKTALSHLCEDEQDEDRLRPLSKSASSAIAAHMDLKSDRQRGPDPRALLDSLLAKMDLLRKDHPKLGTLGTLSSDEAKYIPLVFENLMKLCDHAKQSTEKPKNDKEVEDLRRELHELSNRRESDAEYIEGLRNERDTLVSKGEKLLSRGNDYHSLYLEECRRATELTKECKELRSESRHSTDEYHSLYLDECRRTTELATKCKKLRSEKRQSEEDHNKLYLDERRRTTELTKECEQLRSRLDKAKYDVRTEKYFYKLCRESFYDLLEEKAAVKDKLKQTKAEREALEGELEDLREEQITELTEARIAEATRSSNLQTELTVMRKSHAEEILSNRAAAAEDRRKCLTEHKGHHQKQQMELKEEHRLEIGKKQGQIQRLEQAKTICEGHIAKLKAGYQVELGKKQDQLQRLERENGGLKGQITETKEEYRLEITKKKDRCQRLEQENDDFKGQIAKLVTDHQMELKKNRDQIQRLEREKDDMQGQGTKLKKDYSLELKKARDRILRLKRES